MLRPTTIDGAIPERVLAQREGAIDVPDNSLAHNALLGVARDYLELQGAWTLKVLGGIGQKSGVPDLLACCQGRMVAVECKTGGGVLNRNQRRERPLMECAGCLYVECRSLQDLITVIRAAGLERVRAVLT